MPLQDHEIPTIVIVHSGNYWEADISSNVVYSTTDSGTTSVFMDYSRYTADFSAVIDTDVEVTTMETEPSYSSIIDTFQVDDLKVDAEDITDIFAMIFSQMQKYKFIKNIDSNILAEEFVNPLFMMRLKFLTSENIDWEKLNLKSKNHIEYFWNIIKR